MLVVSALQQLNALAPERAEAEFLKCCGCRNWTRALTDARPFADPGALFRAADDLWGGFCARKSGWKRFEHTRRLASKRQPRFNQSKPETGRRRNSLESITQP